MSSNLMQRVWQHREDRLPDFTARHAVKRLVYFEMFDDMENAILREKQLKNWHRKWKVNLIQSANPDWHDLAIDLGSDPVAPRERKDGS